MKIDIVYSKKEKHEGVAFLIDRETDTFVGKIYKLPNTKEIAQKVKQALNN